MAEHAYDLVIRNGVVADGTGADRFEADIGVRDGRIAAIGRVSGRGAEELDAKGLVVTPGFVDVHTHYDGQATWSERMQPSSWHGVTTVVMGNCGVGFAPCKPEDHDRLIRLMEGVEDIPNPVLVEGLPWNWESFPDYLDALAARKFDVDVGAMLPHAALRVYVMGDRGANREAATEAEINTMAALAKRAMEAGALGFSTSRTINHKTKDGQPTPTLTASEAELLGIAKGLGAAKAGVFQLVTDDPAGELPMLRRLGEASGRPLTIPVPQKAPDPEDWKLALQRIEEAAAAGVSITAQVPARPIGLLLGFDLTLNPFHMAPEYREVAALPLAARAAKLRDPELRAKLIAGAWDGKGGAPNLLQNWSRFYLLSEAQPNYEPRYEESIAAIAAARGVHPAALALDHLLSNDGKGLIYVTVLNYEYGNLDHVAAMLRHPNVVPGLGDGGAHVGSICDGSFPTTLLTHWGRDRRGGELFRLEDLVRLQARDTAALFGLHDRGSIALGLRADFNLIDFDRLALRSPEVAHDLPAGGRRLIQRAIGYRATIVAGEVTYRDGEPTGALPGRLVRGARAASAARVAA